MSAICHVFTTATRGPKKGAWESIGAFLSPRYVLTTAHSVRHMHEVVIEGADRRQSRTRTITPVIRNDVMDVAILDLQVPIGRNFLAVPSSPYAPVRSGLLVTAYNFQAATYPVHMNGNEAALPIIRILSKGQHGFGSPRGSETFTTSVPVIPGYSGSPIVAEDGHTVISVTTKHTAPDQAHIDRLFGVLEQATGIPGLNDALAMIPFEGAEPRQFHAWITDAAQKLALK